MRDRLSVDWSIIPPLPSLVLTTLCPLSTPYFMSSPKKIDLSDHKALLLSYEDEYRQAKGDADARQEVLDKIIEEIAGGKIKKSTTKGLEQVSLPFYYYNPWDLI